MKDPYVYPGTEILKNLADIRDDTELKNMEADYTCYRLTELIENYSVSSFNYEELCRMHHFIFQDVYEWAGQIRVINMEKAEPALGGISVEYTDYKEIKAQIEDALARMNKCQWESYDFAMLVKMHSKYLAEVWKIHPYREGNTRTIITFCNQFIESRGIFIDSELFKDNAAYVRTSLVAASALFSDLGDRRNPEYIERIVCEAFQNGAGMKQQIVDEIDSVGLVADESLVKAVVEWNRKENRFHNREEIKQFMDKK